jgi:hypothetical protein
VRCTRSFAPVLGGAFVQADVRWEHAKGSYEELTLFGVDREGRLAFWSFTSDGKSSHGVAADAADIHPNAIGFEADMPAGRARMAFWPHENDGYPLLPSLPLVPGPLSLVA